MKIYFSYLMISISFISGLLLADSAIAQTPPKFNQRVLVFLWAEDPEAPGSESWRALGTGFLLSAKGDILTAKHVVNGTVEGERIVASIATKSAYPISIDSSDIECASGSLDICFVSVNPGSLIHLNFGEFGGFGCYDLELDQRLRGSGFIGGEDQQAGSSHPVGTVISTELPGNKVGTDLALENTMSGGPITDSLGNIVAIVTGGAGQNMTVVTPIGRVKSNLENRGYQCEASKPEIIKGVVPQEYFVQGEVTCKGGGASGGEAVEISEQVCLAAPQGMAIYGSIDVLEQSGKFATFGAAEYDSSGEKVCVQIACDPPDQPFGPGGWAKVLYKVKAVKK